MVSKTMQVGDMDNNIKSAFAGINLSWDNLVQKTCKIREDRVPTEMD